MDIRQAFWRIGPITQNQAEFIDSCQDEATELVVQFNRTDRNLEPLLICPSLTDEQKALVRKYQQERDALRQMFCNYIDVYSNFLASVGNG